MVTELVGVFNFFYIGKSSPNALQDHTVTEQDLYVTNPDTGRPILYATNPDTGDFLQNPESKPLVCKLNLTGQAEMDPVTNHHIIHAIDPATNQLVLDPATENPVVYDIHPVLGQPKTTKQNETIDDLDQKTGRVLRTRQAQVGKIKGKECVICTTGYEVGSIAVKHLTEGRPVKYHYFHPACLKRWLEINQICPIDRTPLQEPGFVRSHVYHTIAVVISIAEVILFCTSPATLFYLPFSFCLGYLHLLIGKYVAETLSGRTLISSAINLIFLEIIGDAIFKAFVFMPPFLTTINMFIAMAALLYYSSNDLPTM